jgi:hypothetical protein
MRSIDETGFRGDRSKRKIRLHHPTCVLQPWTKVSRLGRLSSLFLEQPFQLTRAQVHLGASLAIDRGEDRFCSMIRSTREMQLSSPINSVGGADRAVDPGFILSICMI